MIRLLPKLPGEISSVIKLDVVKIIERAWRKNEAFKDASHLCNVIYNLSLLPNRFSYNANKFDRRILESNVTDVFKDPENKKALVTHLNLK